MTLVNYLQDCARTRVCHSYFVLFSVPYDRFDCTFDRNKECSQLKVLNQFDFFASLISN